MRGTLIERPVAVVALFAFLATTTLATPSFAASAGLAAGGTFTGRITNQTGAAVLTGAALQASHLGTKTIYTSAETGELGKYVLADLPPGVYDLAVRTEAGLYTVDPLVSLAPGESKTLNLAVRPAAANRKAADEPPAGTAEGAQAPAKKSSFLTNPLTVTLLFLGTATIIGFALDDDDDDDEASRASQSQP